MTTAFPGAIDNFTNPTATDPLDSVTVPHAAQHANVNDAVEAIETAIGTTGAPVLAKLASPTFTGTPAAPTAAPATSTTQLATTDFVTTADNLKSNIASPTFTGTPAAPTAAVATNTTQIATTAFVIANGSGKGFGQISGYYYRTSGGSLVTTSAAVLNSVYYVPLSIITSGTFDRITLKTGSTYSGTGSVRMGIYNNDGAYKPSTVLLDAGTVATTAANIVYEITISQTLSAGSYWLAFVVQTAPTVSTYVGIGSTSGYPIAGVSQSNTALTATTTGGYIQTGITGAFATAGTLTENILGPITNLRAS